MTDLSNYSDADLRAELEERAEARRAIAKHNNHVRCDRILPLLVNDPEFRKACDVSEEMVTALNNKPESAAIHISVEWAHPNGW